MSLRVRVCRDCCCGTREKHPDVDHDALLAELTDGTRGHAEVDVTGCLLACDRSNVVVVSPGPYWFGDVLSTETVSEPAPGCAVRRTADGGGLAAVAASAPDA